MRTCSMCAQKHFGKGYCKKHYDLVIRRSISNAWRAENPEKHRLAVQKWRANNKEKNKMLSNAWKRNHPDVRLANEMNRRARKAATGGKATAGDIARLLELQKGRCAICTCKMGEAYTVDHILPIFLGGSGDPSNLQMLCRSCNSTKSAKHPIDFMQSKGFLL